MFNIVNREEVLSGGSMNQVVKIGDTVHRIVRGSPMLHSYLLYMENEGFVGVPRFLGIDEQGREILTFLNGKTMNDYTIYHECLSSDETIIDMARFLRRFHDTSAGFLQNAIVGEWKSPFPEKNWETICHNDTAIWNFVFVNDRLAGLFDFDQAYPAPRIWDLALSVWSVIPLSSHVPDPVSKSCLSYDKSIHAAERKRRIKLFFDVYGMNCPSDLMDWVIRRIQGWCAEMKNEASAGDEVSIKMVNEGQLAHYEHQVKFLQSNSKDWM